MSDLPSNATVLFNVSINSVCACGAGVRAVRVCVRCVCACARAHMHLFYSLFVGRYKMEESNGEILP